MKKFLLYLWQLPQNILGFLLLIYIICTKYCYRPSKDKVPNKYVTCFYVDNFKGAVCLGRYIFISMKGELNPKVINHECGHARQSQLLGPLYLLVIGIPSFIHAAIHGSKCRNKDYYHFYTEKWANKYYVNEKN